MRNSILTLIKYILPLLVAYLLLRYYVFREVSLAEMVAVFQQADYRWILVSGVFLLLAHFSRAYRWRLLLQPLGYQPGLVRMFLAVMIGYFANLLVPRLGEVTRCGVLQKMNKVPINIGIGTVVAERLFDVVMLLLLLCLNFLLEFTRLSDFFIRFFEEKTRGFSTLSTTFYVGISLLAVLLLGLAYGLYRKRERLWQVPLLARIRDFFWGMWEGLLSVQHMKQKGGFIFHSVFIWVCYYFASYALTFALPDATPLSMLAGLTILMMGSLGMAAPVQGGVGSYHLLVSSALMLYGWTQADGIILATFIWSSQTLLTMLIGGICFIVSLFINQASEPFVQKPVST